MGNDFQDITTLNPEQKRALLRQLLEQRRHQPPSPFPLSHGQQALWFLYQLATESSAYNVFLALRICSPLQIEILQSAIHRILQRHPALRATFQTGTSHPTQKIENLSEFILPITNCTGWDEAQLTTEILTHAHRPFDLIHGPAYRFHLFSLEPENQVLLLAFHHLVTDFLSLMILLNDLREFYQAGQDEPEVQQHPPSATYQEFVGWQQQFLSTEQGLRQWQYWQQQLSGELPILALPTDRVRPPTQTFQGRSLDLALDIEVISQLKLIAQREQTTLFTVLLTAFQLLLFRYCGQEEILIGSPFAGRTSAQFRSTVGYFVNLVVLRTHLKRNLPFRTVLSHNRQIVLEALEHQDFPFPLLVEKLHISRTPNQSPLFQCSFAYDRIPGGELSFLSALLSNCHHTQIDFGPLRVERFPLEEQFAQFDLSLSIFDTNQACVASFQYNTDLFTQETVSRIASHYQQLLIAIAQNPEQPVNQLTWFTEIERHQFLCQREQSGQSLLLTDTALSRFETWVNQSPHAFAITLDQSPLTYRELNEACTRIAQELRQQGVTPNTMVGICVNRTIDQVAGLLAIWKAGGVYVPLDPELPEERIAFILTDTGVSVVLTHRQFAQRFAQTRISTIYLDSQLAVSASQPLEDLQLTVSPQSPAYVIYTSGSTGTPKGVVVSHAALLNHLLVCQEKYEITPADRVLQFASTSFDVSLEQLLLPLISGACAVMRGPELWSIEELFDRIKRHQITVADLPTAYWHQLVQTASHRFPGCLRLMTVGGEAMTTEVARHWQNSPLSCVKLINVYGPTEATISATFFEIPDGFPATCTSPTIPIGRPFPNRTVYILDPDLNPVPIGVYGELHIGGPLLAEGYLNRPELTAEKFIPDPFSHHPGNRLYRTGDRARFLSDGMIEFSGRTDQQIKLRGFRIEPGEIEAVFATCPDVEQSVVMLREDLPGGNQLVAYVVMRSGSRTGADLRTWLKDRLPVYMLPSTIVKLDSFPLTVSGKINRRALPSPAECAKPASDPTHDQPPSLSPIEGILVSIWQDILKQPHLGLHDNFFELGGDSLLSLQVVSRVTQAGLGITPRHIFQFPTIAELAQALKPKSRPAIDQTPVVGPVHLTPIQHWFFEQNLTNRDHWNQAVWLQCHQKLKGQLLQAAWNVLVSHHDALRGRFVFNNEQWEHFFDQPDEAISLVQIDFSHIPESEWDAERNKRFQAAQTQLRIDQGPMIQVIHLDYGEFASDQIFVVIHHLVVDAVSWRILLEDLTTVYGQLDQGQHIQLPSKTTPMSVWAHQLLEYAGSPALEQELPYWNSLPWDLVTALPVEKTGINDEGSTQHLTLTLSETETEAFFGRLKKEVKASPLEALLTGFGLTIAAWTQSQAVLIDLEGHGREDLFPNQIDLSRTVGWFTTIFPIIVEVALNPATIEQALPAVQKRLRQIPSHGIGYGIARFLSEPAVRTSLSHFPQAQISFNYLGQLDQLVGNSSLFRQFLNLEGTFIGPENQRTYLLDLNLALVNQKLQIDWGYSSNLFTPDLVRSLAEQYRQHLLQFATHSQEDDSRWVQLLESRFVGLTPEQRHQIRQRIPAAQKAFPLTPGQQEMLGLASQSLVSTVYLLQMQWTLTGAVDIAQLHHAWQHVWQQCPVLSSIFLGKQDLEHLPIPIQIQLAQPEFEWTVLDWTSQPPAHQAQNLEHWLKQDREQGISLIQSPLCRITIICRSATQTQLIWTLPHILLDGWSVSLVIEGVQQTYAALQNHEVPTWQSPSYDTYWEWRCDLPIKTQPDQSPAPARMTSSLPYEKAALRNRPSPDTSYGVEHVVMDEAQVESLLRFARSTQITVNTLVQAAWALVLARHNREQTVVFGTTVSGRVGNLSQAEAIVGMIMETVAVAVTIPEEQSVAEWLRSIQIQLLSIQEVTKFAPAQIEALRLAEPQPPMFKSVIRFQNYYRGDFEKPVTSDLEWREEQCYDLWHYPLSLSITPGQTISIWATFDVAWIEPQAVVQVLVEFTHTLEKLQEDSQKALSAFLSPLPDSQP